MSASNMKQYNKNAVIQTYVSRLGSMKYMQGEQLSDEDIKAFDALSGCDGPMNPELSRWFSEIKDLMTVEQSQCSYCDAPFS